ncbi:MAG: hypothetical protein WC867_01205 [Candidatus Pacearchaeota archaeon]|jgi:hypothetical protein
MISWLIIISLIIIAIFLIRSNHLKKRFFIWTVFIVIVFLYVTITYVDTKNNLDFSNPQKFFSSSKVYLSWLGGGFGNLKSITGYAVNMDWETENNLSNENKQEFDVNEVETKNNLQPPQNSEVLSKPVNQQIPNKGARIKVKS